MHSTSRFFSRNGFRPRWILAAAPALVAALILGGCGGASSDPTGPVGTGGGSATLLIQRLESATGPVLSEETLDLTQVVLGISDTDRVLGNAAVAQDMAVSFRFPTTGGFLDLQIINYKERSDRGVPITTIEEFDPTADPVFTNGGSGDKVRVTWYPTLEDSRNSNPFTAKAGSASSATVVSIDPEQMIGSFDAVLSRVLVTGGSEYARIASVDAAGSPTDFVAEMSDELGQALDPVAIIEVQPLDPANCIYRFQAGESVDPNGVIVTFGIDTVGNDFILDASQAWDPVNVAQNYLDWDFDPLPPGEFYLTRVFVEDEEGRSNFSISQVVNCP